ncbi:MAG: hypothetical protein V4555_21930 [Acidobacteriota bacterium]
MSHTRNILLRLYGFLLFLYPPAFRDRFADEMIDAARRQALEARSTTRFAASLFSDVFRSLPRAHWQYFTFAGQSFTIALLLFLVALFAFETLSDQQRSRRAADYMPASMARQYSNAVTARTCATYVPGCTQWYAHILASQRPQDIASPSWLNSGLAFVAIYDNAGNALGGNATLNGHWPQPPHGIFDTIRQRGEFRVTWQPQPGVRIALVGRPLASGGFVLSGDGLAQTEAAHARFLRTTFANWPIFIIIAMVLWLVGGSTRIRHTSAP